MGLTSFQGARVVFVVGGSHDLLEKGAGAARSLNTPRFLGGAGEVTHTAGYRDRPDWLNVSICETLYGFLHLNQNIASLFWPLFHILY